MKRDGAHRLHGIARSHISRTGTAQDALTQHVWCRWDTGRALRQNPHLMN